MHFCHFFQFLRETNVLLRLCRLKLKYYLISVSVALRDEELKRVRVAQMADRQRAAAISIER